MRAHFFHWKGSSPRTYLIREVFPSRLSEIQVVLDTKVFAWTTRIVTGRQNYSSISFTTFSTTNCRRNGRRRHDTRCGHPDIRDSIGSQDTADDLHRFLVKVATIPSYNDTVQRQKTNA